MTINDPMLWRLFWKEYRAQRAFWLAVAGCSLALMLVLLIFLTSSSDRFNAPYFIALSMPLLYAWGCAAMLFAAEREDGTWELLRILATTPARTFAAKLSFALVSTGGMIGLLLLAAWGLSFKDIPSIASLETYLGQERLVRVVGFYAELVVWGLFFSAIVKKVLSAVCLAAVVPVTIQVLMNRVVDSPWEYELVVLPILVPVSYILVHRCLSGRSQAWSPSWESVSKDKTGELERWAALRETAPTGMRLFKRLLWQELRQVPRFGLAASGAAVVLLFVVGYPFRNPDTHTLSLAGLTIGPLLMGVWAFRAEQDGSQFRFLADRGISPRTVWLSKQLVWLSHTMAMAALFIVMHAIADANRGTQIARSLLSDIYVRNLDVSVISLALLCVCLSYGAGQFLSMLIPRTVTASFLGLILSQTLIAWMWGATVFRVPLGISAMPLFVILIAATFGWSRNWLLERTTWRRWVRFFGLVGLGLVMVWGSVGAYRVYEVPGLPPFSEFATTVSVATLFRPVTPQEAETAAIYRRAMIDLKWEPSPQERSEAFDKWMITSWQKATAFDRRDLAENEVPLRRVLVATRRPNCAFVDPSSLDPRQDLNWEGWWRLERLLLLSARKLESEQKLDEALDRYLATLRLARHVACRGSLYQRSMGTNIRDAVCQWMLHWAAHPSQTPEQLDGAVRRIAEELAQFPRLSDAICIQEHHSRVVLDWVWADGPESTKDEWSSGKMKVIGRCFPWERLRAVRLLNVLTAIQLQSSEIIEQTLATPGEGLDRKYNSLPEIEYEGVIRKLVDSTPEHLRFPWFGHAIYERAWPERRERGFVLKLALLAWKKRHGQLPERLDQLAGKVPDYMLRDPWAGQDFNYRPRGFPVSTTLARQTVKAGEPLFWSRGLKTGNEIIFKIP